jgi:hypothetical protein
MPRKWRPDSTAVAGRSAPCARPGAGTVSSVAGMAGSYIALGFNRSEARAAVGTGYEELKM